MLEQRVVERRHAELRPSLEVQEQDPEQQERRAGHRVQEELHRGVDPPVAPPPPDDQVHREQQRLEEEEEQQQVEGQERPDHGCLQEQEGQHEVLHLVLDPPRDQHPGRHQERGKQDQEQADAVDPQEEFEVKGPDPRSPVDQLEPGRPTFELPGHDHREDEGDHGDQQRPPSVELVVRCREEGQDDRAGQRQEGQDGQPREVRTGGSQRRLRGDQADHVRTSPRGRPARPLPLPAPRARSCGPDPSGRAGRRPPPRGTASPAR